MNVNTAMSAIRRHLPGGLKVFLASTTLARQCCRCFSAHATACSRRRNRRPIASSPSRQICASHPYHSPWNRRTRQTTSPTGAISRGARPAAPCEAVAACGSACRRVLPTRPDRSAAGDRTGPPCRYRRLRAPDFPVTMCPSRTLSGGTALRVEAPGDGVRVFRAPSLSNDR